MNACIDFSRSSAGEDEHPLLRNNRHEFDPISVIAILTFSFTLIHPLPDGNGRTHRLLIHYLLEHFNILNSWLVPVSVIILHDNESTGDKDRVFREISDPLIQRTKYAFVDGTLIVQNKTKVFYESWDATNAVEYFYGLMTKAVRLSVDCGLYLQIWDRCQIRLKEMESALTASQLKQIISGYLQLGRISKNVVKQFGKLGVGMDVLAALGQICQDQLNDDPKAFKEHFEPINIANMQEMERLARNETDAEEDAYISM